MKTDWRNLLIGGLAGALLWSLWEQARMYFPPPQPELAVGFPQLPDVPIAEVFSDGAVLRSAGPERPPAPFYDSTVRGEEIPDGARTGAVLALFDLMGCTTHWEFYFNGDLAQECYARRDGSYLTLFVHYRYISHLGRTDIAANDNRTGEIVTPGQALQIMQRDFEAAYSASERASIEQRWKVRHPELAGFLESAERPLAE